MTPKKLLPIHPGEILREERVVEPLADVQPAVAEPGGFARAFEPNPSVN